MNTPTQDECRRIAQALGKAPTPAALQAAAVQYRLALTPAAAGELYDKLHPKTGALPDDVLAGVAGGSVFSCIAELIKKYGPDALLEH